MEALDETFVIYNKAGFTIKELHVDPEFKCVKQEIELNEILFKEIKSKKKDENKIENENENKMMNDLEVNVTAAEEHVSDIE